jgi:hypothetical protein
VPWGVKGLFDVQERRDLRHIIVEIKGHVVRYPHTSTLQYRAVTCTETKPICAKQASFFNVLLEFFKMTFTNIFRITDRKLLGHRF